MLSKKYLIVLLLFLGRQQLMSQTINEPVKNKDWTKPYQPFLIVGNLYYVGTYDLASYLIVTKKGLILINTGLSTSSMQIKKNISTLGFDYRDIKILLTNQVHYDHVGAMALIKKETGAKFYVDSADAEALESGGKTDYELGSLGLSFLPIKPEGYLKNKDSIVLDKTVLTVLHHPGHTKGSCSYLMNIKDKNKTYEVLLANIPTIITDKKFKDVSGYPNIEDDYRNTLESMKRLKFDLWLAAHASQFDLHKKHKVGSTYNPEQFRDQKGYETVINDIQSQFDAKTKER